MDVINFSVQRQVGLLKTLCMIDAKNEDANNFILSNAYYMFMFRTVDGHIYNLAMENLTL